MKLQNKTLLAALAASAMMAGAASAGTVWTWTGATSNNLNVTTNWLEDGGVASSFPAANSNQIDTPSDTTSVIIFDSNTWSTGPRNIYTRTGTDWGVIRVLNGTVNWQNDGNNSGNYSYSDATSSSPTLEVGDGDTTAAVANINITQWNESDGDKTYVIYSDGTLASARGGNHDWSNGGNDTVMRILGGAVNINGAFEEADLLSDANDYVSFEAIGSTFTFNKGAAGWFDGSTDVTSGFSTNGGGAFVLGGTLNIGNADLELTDNGGSWTITAVQIVPEPGSLALLAMGGLMVARRRRG